MKIKIRSVNFELTPAIEDYVNKKILLLEKFLGTGENILCEVEIGKTTSHHKSGDIFKAEVNIVEPGGKQIFARAEEADLYMAIDIVRDEAEREIVSAKNKRVTILRKSGLALKNLIKRLDFRQKK